MENVVRTLVYEAQVLLTVADTTEMVREGMRLHALSPVSGKTFGRALSAMTFMSACLKGEKDEISLSVRSNGQGEEIAISGGYNLHLRGYIGNTKAEGVGTEEEVRQCFGNAGTLAVIRDDGYGQPFVGSCELPISGDIDEAFERYYTISEQLPTRIATSVILSDEGECIFAGVVAVQPLPFASEETLKKTASLDLGDVLARAQEKGVVFAASEGFDNDDCVFEERTALYQCHCSREYLGEVLTSLGEAQMRQIIEEDGVLRVHCHYCNRDYEFYSEDADRLFSKK